MSKKYGWVIHYDDGDMDYEENDQEPFETYDEAYEAAEYANGCRSFGADMMHLHDPWDNPEIGDDIGDGEIEVFEVEVTS